MINNWLKKRKSRRLYFNGTTQSLHEEYAKAIKTLSEAIDLDSSHLDSYHNRGLAYFGNGNMLEAIKDFTYVIKECKEHEMAYYNRCITYFAIGEFDLALLDANKSIEIDPKNCSSYTYRSYIYLRKQENQLAIADASRVIDLGCRKDGFNNRALIYQEIGDFSAAILDWTKYMKLVPKDSNALCSRGLCYEKNEDIALAIADLKKGMKNKSQLRAVLRAEAEETLIRLENK